MRWGVVTAGLWLIADTFGAGAANLADGTARMVERLRALELAEHTDPHVYRSDFMAEKLRRQIRDDLPIAEWFRLSYALAETYIRGNLNQEAIAVLDGISERIAPLPSEPRKMIEAGLDRLRGLAWLRFAEQENCVSHHVAQSCLFPIRNAGVHRFRLGSENAVRHLKKSLAGNPGDLRTRWLLNVAAMTLGEYPQEVPEAFRLPEDSFSPRAEVGEFIDIARAAGVDVHGLSGGGVMTDFDGDGWLDLMVSSWGLQDQLRFMINRGDGTFADATSKSGLEGIVGGLNLTCADFDNDGDADVLVLRGAWLNRWGHQPNSLLRNNGDGTFSDVTEAAGLLSFHPTQTATWFDFDGDGWLDVFIGNESTIGDPHASEMYRSNGDGTFTEIAAEAGLTVDAQVKGVAAGDFDNDGRPDLYVSVLNGSNYLFRNRGALESGRWVFEDVTRDAGVAEPVRSFPCWFWDYDNDGWEDLFVAGFGADSVGDVAAVMFREPGNLERPRVYRNNGKGSFDDVSESAGLEQCWLPMGANFGDLDNDGFLDFYVGTGDTPMDMIIPNKMYRNNRGSSFSDVTTSGHFGHLQKGHAISFGDFDNDGDQDIHAVMGGAFGGDRYMNALFANPGNGNSWIKLRLVGKLSNRAGIGARVRVDVLTDSTLRKVFRTVSTGGSFGCNPLRQEIGLGANVRTVDLTVSWPSSGVIQNFRNVETNRAYVLAEDSRQLLEDVLPAVSDIAREANVHRHVP